MPGPDGTTNAVHGPQNRRLRFHLGLFPGELSELRYIAFRIFHTRLFYAGADPKTVQTVLRHAQVAVTMENYVIPDATEVKAAMRKFGKTVQALGITRKK